jgi:excisionase family DNA binding protein
MSDNIEDLVSIKEIMPLLGQRKVVSAYDFVHRNSIPYYRVGQRKILFSKSDVLAWIKARQVGRVPLGNRANPAVKAALMGGRA